MGRADLRLISPDRKQVLLHKQIKDVASCVQGAKNSEHFGFICREATIESFVGYIFKCQSESVADDLVAGETFSFYIELTARLFSSLFSTVLSNSHHPSIRCNLRWYEKGEIPCILLRTLSHVLV